MRLSAVVLLVVCLSGCRPDWLDPNAHPDAEAVTTGQVSIVPPVRISGSTTVVPTGVRQLPDSQVDAHGLPPGYPHVVWDAPEMRRLQMLVPVEKCENAHAEAVEQSATSVRVELVIVTPHWFATPPCMPEPRMALVEAWIDQPAADRTVVLTLRRV